MTAAVEPPHIDTSCRAEMEKTEQWYRDRGDLPGAARARRYLDYIALPAAQRRAIDEAIELHKSQIRHMVVFCEDGDIVLMAAQHLMSDTSCDEMMVCCYDGPNLHHANITRNETGICVEVHADLQWPYQRPAIGNA